MQAHGYVTDLCILARVARLIGTISGQRYSESGVWRLLKGLDFSCRQPVGRARQRDEAAIRRWRQERWPTLEKTVKTVHAKDAPSHIAPCCPVIYTQLLPARTSLF